MKKIIRIAKLRFLTIKKRNKKMNATAIITFSITVAGFVFTMITHVAKLSVNFGKLSNRLDQNETRDKGQGRTFTHKRKIHRALFKDKPARKHACGAEEQRFKPYIDLPKNRSKT